MKKIIRYLAKEYGVYAEAYRHGVKDTGASLNDLSFMFPENPHMKKSLQAISEKLIKYGHFGNGLDMRIQINRICSEPVNPSRPSDADTHNMNA